MHKSLSPGLMACFFIVSSALAQDIAVEKDDVVLGARTYSPYLHQAHPNQVYWGDTHLHTTFSTDAGMVGNRLGPDEALRFAKGETVTASMGVPARLIRPLDFLVISDHAENLGLPPMIEESNPELLQDPWGKMVHDLVRAGEGWEAYNLWKKAGNAGDSPLQSNGIERTAWNRIIDVVDRHNEPGKFTAFHGFEWTSTPELRNLHRVVIFADDADKARQVVPFSMFDSADPEDLWDYLENYVETTGGQAIAIPHNGNLSQGLMFADETFSGEPLTEEYARRRMKWEPIYEVTQIKGDGEAHPALSPNDEFADYYTWDRGDFGLNPKQPEMLPHEYARSALKLGLEQEARIGANPFKFGMIGATDSHTALATAKEDNYFGKFTPVEPGTGVERYEDLVSEDLRPDGDGSLTVRHFEALASGLAGVWARENTRQAIFDAMRRKEVYATTGSRMLVRVFAGWDFDADEVHRPDFAEQGYRRGVPMGGDMLPGPENAAPRFMVRALRDPDGANIDRIQIVKGWLEADGTSQEKVFDVAWSGDRQIGPDGKLPPVGNTVDTASATYTNTIGEAVIAAHWEDPEFDPAQRAFYYVRVLEIPTPTWLAYDSVQIGEPIPEEGLLVHQERAYTSPIWYTP